MLLSVIVMSVLAKLGQSLQSRYLRKINKFKVDVDLLSALER